jgi:hypothetical protein
VIFHDFSHFCPPPEKSSKKASFFHQKKPLITRLIRLIKGEEKMTKNEDFRGKIAKKGGKHGPKDDFPTTI